MAHVIYRIVEHDGGWAYRVDGVYSETFSTRELAHKAAARAVSEQRSPGPDAVIEFETAYGHWITQNARGGDRPDVEVKD